MMKTEEIPYTHWRDFFKSFSQKHFGWLADLEILDPELGDQTSTHELPLLGITSEAPEAGEGALFISLGKDPENASTHTISFPLIVRVKQTERGADEVLEIETARRETILLHFRSPIPPEEVDGFIG